MGARRIIGIGAIALAAVAGSSACSEDPPPVVSQEEYDTTAADLCERHGGEVLSEASNLLGAGSSDAQINSFLRTEYVPQVRAIVRGLNRNGFPAEKAATYTGALNQVLEALTEVDDEDEGYALLDRLRLGILEDDENPIILVQQGMEEADVICGRQAPPFDPGPSGG
jgi:hypothetical protein